MSETQIQTIKDVMKMTTKVNMDCLISVKKIMEEALDAELRKLEPTIILENMDITEKIMYLDYLTEDKEEKDKELKESISFEEILKREGLDIDELQD